MGDVKTALDVAGISCHLGGIDETGFWFVIETGQHGALTELLQRLYLRWEDVRDVYLTYPMPDVRQLIVRFNEEST